MKKKKKKISKDSLGKFTYKRILKKPKQATLILDLR